MALSFELGAKIRVIVNLAVVSNEQPATFDRHRLMASTDVNYAQPAMAQPNIFINKQPLLVWPAMRNHIAHTFKQTHVNYITRPAR
jgi:hypothetical protein